MTQEEFEGAVLPLLKREPFVPFEFELVNGVRWPVTRPRLFSYLGGNHGWLWKEGGGMWGIVDCPDVATIHVADALATAS